MDEKIKDIKINSETVRDMTLGKAFGTKDDKSTVDSTVNDIIIKNAQNSNNVKSVIDLAATSKALENEKTVDKIVDEKTQELIRDAESKKIESEIENGKLIAIDHISTPKELAQTELFELENWFNDYDLRRSKCFNSELNKYIDTKNSGNRD